MYMKFIVLHRDAEDYISTREHSHLREKEKNERKKAEYKVLWTERNRKQIHILPGAKWERESENERVKEEKWRKTFYCDK